jgi:hypothetical protein
MKTSEGEKAERLEGGRWNRIEVRTVADLPKFKPSPVELSRYGGLASGPKLRPTGFFRTERVDAGWTLVDPEGCPFISIGLCSVNLGTFAEGSEAARFGSREKWAESTANLLRECGFNTLGRWSVPQGEMDRWASLSGRPILNSEWYAMSLASAEVPTGGAGFRVRSQRDRGLFYQNLCLGMLGDANCVGWHWFKYMDNDINDPKADPSNRDANKGIVKVNYSPYAEVLALMKQLNQQVYPLTEYFKHGEK